MKGELLAILDRFDADALVLLREGRAIIGAVLLGAKVTGGDFTDYDYDTISRVYGKLFVVAYYLKNVAQESLVLAAAKKLYAAAQLAAQSVDAMAAAERIYAETYKNAQKRRAVSVR